MERISETRFSSDETVNAALDRYLDENGFTHAAYEEAWTHASFLGVPVAVPNTRLHKQGIRLHDLHHVATGYQTTWRGESEIAAWELAAGCGKFYAAWILNLGAFALGLVIAPRRTLRAFARGRRSTTLYRTGVPADLAVRDVAELRALLKLDAADRG